MDAKEQLKFNIMDNLLFSKCLFNKSRKPYEEFLLNVVNSSRHFLCKSNNKKYVCPSSESNGECDCISDCYKLDFKLLISNSYMEGKSISSKYYIYPGKGIRIDQYPIKELRRNEVGLIHKQLSSSYTCKKKLDDTDLNSIKECLNKQKNLLLFLPYEFSFVYDKNSFDENDINKILTVDFIAKLVKFRKKYIDKYDTYFVYIFDKSTIISIINEKEIRFLEKISLKDNEVYNLLCWNNQP